MAGAANQDTAASFVRFVTGESAAAIWKAASVDTIRPEA
jgi:hypothetical protein